MALQKNIFRVQLGRGSDTKKTDIVLEPGELEVLENAVIEKSGRLEKRKGCSTSNWEPAADDPVGSYVYRKNLVIEGDKSLSTLLGSDNETVTLGYNRFFESELFHVTGGGRHHQEMPSLALSHSGDYIAVCWTQAYFNYTTNVVNYEYRISVIDRATGTIVNSDMRLESSGAANANFRGQAKVVAHGNTDAADDSFAVYYEYSGFSIFNDITLLKTKFSHDTVELPSPSMIIAGYSGPNAYRQTAAEASFDVTEYLTGANNYQKVHIVYTGFASSTHKATYVLDDNDTLSGSQSFNQTGAMTQLAVYRSSAAGTGRVYFSFAVGTTLHLRQQNEATSSDDQFGATDSIGAGLTVTEVGGYCDSEDGALVEYFVTVGTTASTFESKLSRYQITPNSATIDSDAAPFRLNAWMPLGPIKTTGGLHYFVCQENRNTEDNDTMLHTATAWAETSDDPTSIGWDMPHLYRGLVGATLRQSLIRSHINGASVRVISDGTDHYSVLPRTTNLQSFADGAGAVTTAINSACHLIKFTTAKPVYETPRAQLGGELFFSPGTIKSTSSERIHEAGFFYKPGLSLAETTGGNLTTTSVYKFRGVWEWEDSFGNLHRSEPSDEESFTLTGSNNAITVTCDGLSATLRDYNGRLSLVLYRTQAGGSIYNKIATLNNPPFDSSITVTPIITHTDLLSDANAATGAFLYTEGGELANVAPPASRYIEAHRNRLFCISEDNRIWFSKEYENKVGLSFSDSFQIPMDGLDHDKPTALASMGNDLIIFRERSIWTISGEGPSKTGVGEFYKPRQMSATIGALKSSPTLYADSGVYFQNARGIFRIGQEGIEYIGAPVEDLVGSSRIVAIRHHQKTETIRFALTDKVLAYNYRYKAWSNYTYSLGSELIVGMENIDDTVYVITDGDQILKEDTSFKVGTNYISLKMTTGWISFNEIQGFGRAYRFSVLGESRDKHIMTVNVYYDYDDSASVDTYTFTTSSAADARLQFRAHLSRQKCEAVKFEISDADNSASTGDGYAIDHIAIEVGLKKGTFRTTEANTIGAD